MKLKPQQPPTSIDEVLMQLNLPTEMRDGVKLSTDVYRPRRKGRYPVILVRTPYSNNDDAFVDFGKRFASWGYAVALQDVRGRHDAEGEWYPSKSEGPDGFDTLKWLDRQPWSNGRVGMTGGSYNAMVQWDVALLKPPNLKAMVSMVCPSDLFINCWYRCGTLGWGDSIRWLVHVDGRVNQNVLAYNMKEIYGHVPFTTVDEAVGRRVNFWRDWLKHQSHDHYWKTTSYHGRYSQIDVPVLHITGWYDDCADGNIQNYLGMKESGRSQKARKSQRLIVGPWPHRMNQSRKYGEIDFGPDALVDLQELQKRWFDFWLKDEQNGIINEKPVSIFVMGLNKWREEQSWPLLRAKPTRYYLHSGGRANSLSGNGWLTDRIPSQNERSWDEYDYDPNDPCPSPVGVNEPDDRRPAERRDDTLIYDTKPLTKPIEVTGNVILELFASSSARDTDFAAHLVDVYPNGYAHPVADGIITARYRSSLTEPTPIVPGKVFRFDINLWHTSNMFLKKHKIRVEISSADFPRYARNMNTGKPYGADLNPLVAHQKVFHESKHPSNVLLPIVS